MEDASKAKHGEPGHQEHITACAKCAAEWVTRGEAYTGTIATPETHPSRLRVYTEESKEILIFDSEPGQGSGDTFNPLLVKRVICPERWLDACREAFPGATVEIEKS